MSVLLNHILSTVTETSGPPALNTLPYPSIFMQCKSRLGFTDVICTGPEGVYGNSISLMRTDLPRQKLNYVNWLNVPKVHGMLLIVPCRPITVNIPCTLIWQGDSCTLSSLSSCSPISSCSLLPCAMSEPAPSPCLVADSDTPGSCSGSLPSSRGLATGQEHSRLPTDFKGSISGFPRALPLNLRRQG